MNLQELDLELRGSYTQDEIDEMGKKGEAMGPDSTGHYSYPIGDTADLGKAISAVGRGNAAHNAIRKYIIGRAKALDASSEIPDNWNSDGSLKPETNSARTKRRHRSERGVASTREFRVHVADLEIRDMGGDGNTVELVGTPIVYDQPYTVRDMFGEFEETMLPGVVTTLLASGTLDTRFLVNHGGLPLARTASGTLTLRDTASGLQAVPLLDLRQSLASDLVIAVERGDCNQMSVGMIVAEDGDEWSDDWSQRSISQLSDLLDVSAVTFPASPTTSIDLARAARRAVAKASPFDQARIKKMWAVAADLRSGKAISATNAQALQSAVATLHGLLDQADPDDLAESDEDDSSDAESGSTEVNDGSSGGPSTDPSAGVEDGSGSRAEKITWTTRFGKEILAERFLAAPESAQRRSELRVDGSFTDVLGNLEAALEEHLILDADDGWLWVVDAGADWVVWEQWGNENGLFMASYLLGDDQSIAFTTEPCTVARVTTYVEVEQEPEASPALVLANQARSAATRAKVRATLSKHA